MFNLTYNNKILHTVVSLQNGKVVTSGGPQNKHFRDATNIMPAISWDAVRFMNVLLGYNSPEADIVMSWRTDS
jgi:hypothetical protein